MLVCGETERNEPLAPVFGGQKEEYIPMAQQYLLASDFDQTLSFNDSGVVLSELIGLHDFHGKVKGLSDIHLVQQGAELSYLILHDPDFRRVRRDHLIETGKRIRLKHDVSLFARSLDNLSECSALEIQSKIDSMITDATGTAATWRYIICNTGLHDAIYNGPDTTYPKVVTLAQETTAWNYIINALTTAFPNAELIWRNTSQVNETIADKDGMTWSNALIKTYSDSMYNLFKNHGFKKRLPVDSFITAAGLQPDTADGIHYTNGNCYWQIASWMAGRIRQFTACNVNGWDGSNCLYYGSSSLFPYRPLPDSTKWSTWSPFYNIGSSIVLMHHALGTTYYNLSADAEVDGTTQYVALNGNKIMKVGDATGITIELACNVVSAASGYIFSVMSVYDNANNYLSVFYVSNTLYVKMHIGGVQVLESETGGLTDGNHVITIQENNGTPFNAWYVYYDGVYQSVFAASTFTPYTFSTYPKIGCDGLGAGHYAFVGFQGVRIYCQMISTARITAGVTNIYTLGGQAVKADTSAGTFHFTPSLVSPKHYSVDNKQIKYCFCMGKCRL